MRIVHVTKSNVFNVRFCIARIYKSNISQLVMHDTGDNTHTLLWASSVAQRTSYKTSIDNAHTQLIGPLISGGSSSYRHIQF